MSENSKKSGEKSKERGLNVHVIQEDKDKDDAKVRVNYHAGKKNTSKKTTKAKSTKTAAKKTKKKTTAKKTTAKKTTSKKTTKSKKTITVKNETKTEKVKVAKGKKTKVAVKKEEKKTEEKPAEASAAKNSATEKPAEASAAKNSATEKKEEKPASFSESVKAETKTEAEPKAEKKAEEEKDYFETLILNTEPEKSDSKIILRDVERTSEEVEEKPAEASAVKDSATEKKEEKPALTEVIIDTAKVSTRESKLSAREIKEQEIKKAISTATKLPETKKKRTRNLGRFGWARITLMITCATTAVFSLVYFINIASSDMPLTVVAANSGIEASYPDYIPRGYELSDITSASGKITMNFKSENGAFILTEESSDWDSKALLNNYIKENYADDDYATITENGLTIYMGANWEAWVNGGILYKLNVKTGSLTKKQLKTIATSL